MITLDALAAHAPEYELGALLKLLIGHGFDWASLRFEGVRELGPRRGGLVRGLRIETEPARRAIVQLDTGLLSSSSPLPEYFRDFGRRLADPDAFVNFLGFWDSAQLWSIAYASFPECSVGRGRALQHGYRARLQLGSPMTLHWLFKSTFPELGVEVACRVFCQSSASGRARVGSTLDGRLVIGADFTEHRPGFRIQLSAEAPSAEGVRDWEREALDRLSRIEPLLERVREPLEVVLRYEQYLHGQRLVDGHSERRQLGVRPWLRPVRDDLVGPADVIVRSAGG